MSAVSVVDEGMRLIAERDARVAVPAMKLIALLVVARAAVEATGASEEGRAVFEAELSRSLATFPSLTAEELRWPELYDAVAQVLMEPVIVDQSTAPAPPAPVSVIFHPGAFMFEQPRRGPVRLERLPDGGARLVPE